ncbi:MAG: hypothetical protein H8K04_16620 [Nitrospira sp.]
MTVTVKQPVVVWALLLVIVLMNGFMTAPSVSHVEHHTGHQAATHSTGICAWLCAGGVGIESSVVQFVSGLQLLEWANIPSFHTVFSVILVSYFFRGPPSLT